MCSSDLQDCEFIGNTADWRGGALCFSSSTASLEIVGGKFEGNCTVATDLSSSTSSYGGSAIQLTAPITVDITGVQFLNSQPLKYIVTAFLTAAIAGHGVLSVLDLNA